MNIEELEQLLKPKEEIVYIANLKRGDKFRFIQGCSGEKEEICEVVQKVRNDFDEGQVEFSGMPRRHRWSFPCCKSLNEKGCCYVLKVSE